MQVRFPLARKNRVEMSVCVKKLLKMGLVLARVWGGEAVGIASTERWKLGGVNGGSFFLVVCKEVNNLEVEQDPSTMVTLFWAEGWQGKWRKDQQKARKKQIADAQAWRQVRGPTGAVVS